VTKHERPEDSHKFGHTHLEDIVERADRFKNEVIIVSHFSTRQHSDTIRKIVEKRLPESIRDRVKIWL
jgi:ribonuclease Z